MDLNINKEIEVSNLAKKFLQTIAENCLYPRYFNKYHERTSKYRDEFEKEFEESLSESQKEDYRTLTDIQNAVSSTEGIYDTLYGMKVYGAFLELINNPLKVIELFESNGTDIRERCKSSKRLKEENANE